MITVFAAISIGSYEIEMKIFEISKKYGIREIDRISQIIELGTDTYNEDKISFDMVDRLCDILSDYNNIMKSYKVKEYRAVATSAIREALNCNSVLDQIKVRTGLEVELLSNSELRLISYKGFIVNEKLFNIATKEDMMLVDLGAGSAQITLFGQGQLITTQNIRLGTLRIREVLGKISPSAEKYREILKEYIDNDLATFAKIFFEGHHITHIVGIGENLSYVNFSNDSEKPYVSLKYFNKVFESLIGKTEDELSDMLDVPEAQASLIVPSLMFFSRLFEYTAADKLWTPNIKLNDGIVADYANKNDLLKMEHDFENDILSATRVMAKRFQCNTVHAKTVEKSALSIFDAMKKRHGLGKRERLILQIAAILHDCGKFVSLMYPSEAGYNIIMTTEIIGLSHEERMCVARIVKYNNTDFDYTDVNLMEAKLTAILRMANALDRSHKQKMKDIKAELNDNILNLVTHTYEDITLEKGLLEEKCELFEEVYGVKTVLKKRKAI